MSLWGGPKGCQLIMIRNDYHSSRIRTTHLQTVRSSDATIRRYSGGGPQVKKFEQVFSVEHPDVSSKGAMGLGGPRSDVWGWPCKLRFMESWVMVTWEHLAVDRQYYRHI